MEIWKEIKGGKVSHKGRVFGKRKILTPVINNGYAYVMLKHNGKYKHYAIHRLVTEAFIPNPDNKPEVNHINANKADKPTEPTPIMAATFSGSLLRPAAKRIKPMSGNNTVKYK